MYGELPLPWRPPFSAGCFLCFLFGLRRIFLSRRGTFGMCRIFFVFGLLWLFWPVNANGAPGYFFSFLNLTSHSSALLVGVNARPSVCLPFLRLLGLFRPLSSLKKGHLNMFATCALHYPGLGNHPPPKPAPASGPWRVAPAQDSATSYLPTQDGSVCAPRPAATAICTPQDRYAY